MADATFTETDGRILAAQLLHELTQWYRDHCHDNKHLLPDDDSSTAAYDEANLNREPEILRRYLAIAQKDAALERGMLCVLTEYLASCHSGGVPTFEFLEELCGAVGSAR